MKKVLLAFMAASITLIAIFFSCRKGSYCNGCPGDSKVNHPPVADAGADLTVTLSSCTANDGFAELNGSGSSDPDNDIIRYKWEFVQRATGTGIPVVENATAKIASVANFARGIYVFELTVIDVGGMISKDTVVAQVISENIQEYNLDVTFNGAFIFKDDINSCDVYPYPPCGAYDYTEINGLANQPDPVLGEMKIYIEESSEINDIGEKYGSYMHVYSGDRFNSDGNTDVNTFYIRGDCSVFFKKLIKNGGGSFSGTFPVWDGLAAQCSGKNVFYNLPPLTISGHLSTSGEVTIRLQGKTYY